MEEKDNENHNQDNGNKTENGDETDNVAHDRVCSPVKEVQKDKSKAKGRLLYFKKNKCSFLIFLFRLGPHFAYQNINFFRSVTINRQNLSLPHVDKKNLKIMEEELVQRQKLKTPI